MRSETSRTVSDGSHRSSNEVRTVGYNLASAHCSWRSALQHIAVPHTSTASRRKGSTTADFTKGYSRWSGLPFIVNCRLIEQIRNRSNVSVCIIAPAHHNHFVRGRPGSLRRQPTSMYAPTMQEQCIHARIYVSGQPGRPSLVHEQRPLSEPMKPSRNSRKKLRYLPYAHHLLTRHAVAHFYISPILSLPLNILIYPHTSCTIIWYSTDLPAHIETQGVDETWRTSVRYH